MRASGAVLAACCFIGLGCSSSEVVDLEAAVVEVNVATCDANQQDRATAAVVDRGLAVTAAHTFDDAAGIAVTVDGEVFDADLVFVDAARDIALVSFDRDRATQVLEIADDSDEASTEGRVVVFRDGVATIQAVALLRRTEVTLDGEGRRQGIELGGSIDAGDSGAPVVDDDGRLIGMVFATSRTDDTGWAVAGSELIDITERASEPLPLTCS